MKKQNQNEFGILAQYYSFVNNPYKKRDLGFETCFVPSDPRRIFRTKQREPINTIEFHKAQENMKNKDFILNNPTKIIYQAIPLDFRKEKNFVLKVLSLTEETGLFYVFLPLSMREDLEVCLTAIKHTNLSEYSFEGRFVNFIPEELKEKKEIFESLADSHIIGNMLEFLPSKFQTIETVIKFLTKEQSDFKFVTNTKEDEEKTSTRKKNYTFWFEI